MPLNEFWHGELYLFKAYQIAYYRDVSYRSYVNGCNNNMAFSVAYSNVWKDKGKKDIEMPKWKDPFAKHIAETKESQEIKHRNLMLEQQEWLRALRNS